MICPIDKAYQPTDVYSTRQPSRIEGELFSAIWQRLNDDPLATEKLGYLIRPDIVDEDSRKKYLASVILTHALSRGVRKVDSSRGVMFTAYGEEAIIPFSLTSTPKVFSSRMQALIKRLSRATGIEVIDYFDPNDRRKGYFKQDKVYLNLAYASESTPLHEFYHPFVRVIKNTNPTLWEELTRKAKVLFPKMEEEEAVVEMLAIEKTYSSLYHRVRSFILEIIRKLFNLNKPLPTIRTYGQLLDYLDNPLKEDLKYSDLEAANSVMGDFYVSLGPSAKPNLYDALHNWVEEQGLSTSDADDFYVNKAGQKVARRVTHFVGDKEVGAFTRQRKFDMPYAEYLVRQIFKRKGVELEDFSQTIEYEGEQITAQELIERLTKRLGSARTYGKMIHAFMQYLVEEDKTKKTMWRTSTLDYARQLIENGSLSGTFIEPFLKDETLVLEEMSILAPYKDALETVLDKLDLSKNDVKLLSEISFASEGIIQDEDGNLIGGTADLVIVTKDNELVMVDWKTGNIFSDINSAWLMPYGEEFLINDSKLSRDSLSLVLRTMMIKEKFPFAKFKGVYIVKLSKNKRHYLHQVNLEDFLGVVENYLKSNGKGQLVKNRPDMFNAREYRGVPTYVVHFREKYAQQTPELNLMYAYNRLKRLTARYSADVISSSPSLRDEVDFWTKVILELESLATVNIDYKGADLPDITWQLKSLTDISDPKVATFSSVLSERKQRINEDYQRLMKEHDRLASNVIKEKGRDIAKKLRDLNKIPLVIGVVTANPLIFFPSLLFEAVLKRLQLKTSDVFGFMWVKKEGLDSSGWFLNTSDTHNGQPLTEAQKAYRDFFKENIHILYQNVISTPVLNDKGDVTTYGAANGLPSTLKDDFMPRVPKSLAETKEESLIPFKGSVQYFFRKYLTDYLDVFVSEQPSTTVSMKYILPDDSAVVVSENHSFDPTRIFALYASSMLSKQHLEDVLALGLGLRSILNEEKDFRGNRMYPNFVKFLDAQISLQFPIRKPPSRHVSRPIVLGSKIAKLMGIPEGKAVTLDPSKLAELLRLGVAYSVLGFRLVSAVKNAILITVLNVMQSTEARVAAIVGVPPERYSPKANVVPAAFKDLLGLFKDYMLGTYKKNKLYLLAKQLDFIPDNYSYYTMAASTDESYSSKRNASTMSYAFMFQNLAETYGALFHLAILARSVKLENAKGEVFSIWDAYEARGEELIWTKGKRGVVVIGEREEVLEGLHTMEIKNLKRAYEVLHGSYRREEAIAIQANIFGQFLVQFKRYFFRYIKELYASRYTDFAAGQFVKREDITRPDGMPVWEWESTVMEGRIRTLAGATMALLHLGSDNGLRQYLKYDYRKSSLAKLANTGLWLFAMMLVYGLFFDDDDDKYAAKWASRIIRDASRGLHPMDFVDFVKTPVIAASKSAEVATALWVFLTRGLWEGPTRSGYPRGAKTILRSLPGTSSALQLEDLFLHSDNTLPWR